jgi:hypothetical protein
MYNSYYLFKRSKIGCFILNYVKLDLLLTYNNRFFQFLPALGQIVNSVW